MDRADPLSVVYLGLGSNLCPGSNLRLGVRELSKRFTLQEVSPVYRNQAFGFDGDDFLNAVVRVHTFLTPLDVCRELDVIHDMAGRARGGDAFVSRTLDIDLLLYDQAVIDERPVRVPRADILEYGFVLKPLADISPDLIHPVSGRSIADHWAEFDASSHPLSRDELSL